MAFDFKLLYPISFLLLATPLMAANVRQSPMQPILPLQTITLQTVPLMNEVLRDPVVERSSPKDDSDASNLVQDMREYSADITRSQGARRLELIEKSFEAHAALAAYLEDLASGKIENNAGSEKIQANLQSERQKIIEFAQAFAIATKNKSHKARALYHVYINQYLLRQNRTASLKKLSEIKKSLAAPLANRVDFLIASSELDSANNKTRTSAQATMKSLAGKLSSEGSLVAHLLLAKSYAGITQRGTKTKKADPQYRNHLATASNKAGSLSTEAKGQVFSYTVSIWRTAEGRTATWNNAPINLARFETNLGVKALVERTAIEDWANDRKPNAIKKYESLAASLEDGRSFDMNARALELHRAVWMSDSQTNAAYTSALTYERAILKHKNRIEDQSATDQASGNRGQQAAALIAKRHQELVVTMLDRSMQKSASSALRQNSIRMANDYSANVTDGVELESIKGKTGAVYALNNQHSDAVRVYLALAEKSASGNTSKYLVLAGNSQRILARWPESAPWNSIPSGDAAEREQLTAIYKRQLDAGKSKSDWTLVSHIGLLDVTLGKSEAAFALWNTTLESAPQGVHAANAAGFMLTVHRSSKQWQAVETLARFCTTKNISPIHKKSRLDTTALLALALLEGGKELLAAQKFDQAVTKLYEFTKSHSRALNHDEGFFLLASAYRGAAKHPESIQTLQAFSERYEKSKYYKTALLNGGDWAVPLAFEDHALYFYSKFLKKFENDAQSLRVSDTVIDISMGKALYSKATESLRWQVKQNGIDSTKRTAAAKLILKIEERQGEPGRAFLLASEFATAKWTDDSVKAEALAIVARHHAGSKNYAKLKGTEKAIAALGGSSSEAQEALGEVRFLLAESQGKVMAENVFNLELKDPYATISEQHKIFNLAKSQYAKVCESGATSWCAPAMSRIATLSGGLIRAVEEVEIPETLAKEEVDKFNNRKNSMMDEMAKVAEAADTRAIALVSQGKTNPDWTQKVLWNNSSDWNFERVSGETGNAFIQYSASKAE